MNGKYDVIYGSELTHHKNGITMYSIENLLQNVGNISTIHASNEYLLLDLPRIYIHNQDFKLTVIKVYHFNFAYFKTYVSKQLVINCHKFIERI